MARSKRQRKDAGGPPFWRLAVVMVATAGVVLALVGRALDLQVLNRDFLRDEAEARHLRTVAISAYRGMITDRNGAPLAVSSPVYSSWANPAEVLQEEGGVAELARALGRSEADLREYLERRKQREFVYLRRHMPPDLSAQIRSLDIPGVNLQRELRRFYPAGQTAAQLIGFTDIDGRGLEGVERALDEPLSGEQGAKRVMRDRLGRVIDDVELIREPRPGEDVELSIDRDIQYLAFRELKRAVHRHRAESGSVVVLDVHTGELLAVANKPSFNPHQRAQMDPEARRNRAFANAYEPGSVIKPFTIAAALRSGSVSPQESFDTAPGTMRVGRHTVRDLLDYGELDLAGVMQKSSNVGAAKVALQTPPRELWQVMQDFEFGAPSGVSFASESAGHLDASPPRGEVRQATWSYGYGMSTTPVQLARSYAALANGGVIRPVTILRQEEEVEGHRVLDEDIAQQIRSMLETVIEPGGTGVRASVPGYRVAGKTGTVRKAVAGGYSEDEYIAMFVGYAPAENPRIAVAVVIDDPAGEAYYGGQVAAPVFSEVASGALRILNVPPQAPPSGMPRIVADWEEGRYD
ncbi:cell division protein FtsI [Halorhodospira halochloris]|uniref:Peptidoglycan D,D-transpeptidase FtsI n=2 Tax=Halorhodospira halochloris TaxID=1052 RepID=A0A0X8XBP0_HALHR|nr:penicillin-binding protein 2 [Halorhodospira halochloris]BAU58518.1 cell division protein FtsI [Halorhodospira halochloris]